jgi:hypothetical protein
MHRCRGRGDGRGRWGSGGLGGRRRPGCNRCRRCGGNRGRWLWGRRLWGRRLWGRRLWGRSGRRGGGGRGCGGRCRRCRRCRGRGGSSGGRGRPSGWGWRRGPDGWRRGDRSQGGGRCRCRSAGRGGCCRRLLGRRAAGDQPGTGPLDRKDRRRVGRNRSAAARRCRGWCVRADQVRAGLTLDHRFSGLLRCGLLGGGGLLRRRSRLLGLDGASEALAVSLPAGAVGLGILDGRGMALDAHPEG